MEEQIFRPSADIKNERDKTTKVFAVLKTSEGLKVTIGDNWDTPTYKHKPPTTIFSRLLIDANQVTKFQTFRDSKHINKWDRYLMSSASHAFPIDADVRTFKQKSALEIMALVMDRVAQLTGKGDAESVNHMALANAPRGNRGSQVCTRHFPPHLFRPSVLNRTALN